MIQSKQDYDYYLEQDRIMNGWLEPQSFTSRIKDFISPNPIKKFLFLLRKSEYYTNCLKHNTLWGGVL